MLQFIVLISGQYMHKHSKESKEIESLWSAAAVNHRCPLEYILRAYVHTCMDKFIDTHKCLGSV